MVSQQTFYTKIFLCLVILILSCFCLGGLECHYDDDDDDDHNVSRPDRPDGPTTAKVDESVQFETDGSTCSEGDSVEYRFDFGDSTQSDWSKDKVANHTYEDEGSFKVSAQARCSKSKVTSSWSDSFTIDIDDRLNIHSLWKDSQNRLWTVGKKGLCLLFAPDRKQEKITDSDLYGIWGTDQKIFCCGKDGTILFKNGEKWQKNPVPTTETLYRISGKEEILFSVGNKGTILHFDGEKWLRMISPTQNNLYGLWVHQSNSVFAVGAKGSILYFNGETWQKWETEYKEDLYDVWGSDYGNVFAVGNKGTLLHFDGTAWKSIPCTVSLNWKTIYAVNATEIYIGASNGTLARLVGEKLQRLALEGCSGIEAIALEEGYKKIFILNKEMQLQEFLLH